VPSAWSRIIPVAVSIFIPALVVSSISATVPGIPVIVGMVIPAVTSARRQHDAGRDNSVHDHFECVHKTFLKKPAFIISPALGSKTSVIAQASR
jgi:hypothetical protein